MPAQPPPSLGSSRHQRDQRTPRPPGGNRAAVRHRFARNLPLRGGPMAGHQGPDRSATRPRGPRPYEAHPESGHSLPPRPGFHSECSVSHANWSFFPGECVEVFLVSGSFEERRLYAGDILSSQDCPIVLCSLQYTEEVRRSLRYFVNQGFHLNIQWLNPGYHDPLDPLLRVGRCRIWRLGVVDGVRDVAPDPNEAGEGRVGRRGHRECHPGSRPAPQHRHHDSRRELPTSCAKNDRRAWFPTRRRLAPSQPMKVKVSMPVPKSTGTSRKHQALAAMRSPRAMEKSPVATRLPTFPWRHLTPLKTVKKTCRQSGKKICRLTQGTNCQRSLRRSCRAASVETPARCLCEVFRRGRIERRRCGQSWWKSWKRSMR